MKKEWNLISSIACILIIAALFAGCTSTPPQLPAAPVATGNPVTATPTPQGTPAPVAAPPASAAPITAAVTATPVPAFTPSEKTLVVFTAASLSGVSKKLGKDFSAMYPGHEVVFNLDGTQALKTQVENGAYCDVFISASNAYTNTLKGEGYFVDSSVKPLTTNYVTVIVPASNPGNIKSLADLATPKKKIALAAYTVPVGTASYAALANLAKSTYGADWNRSVFANVVTYETSEPGVAAKVSLGEVDAGLVYESTATAAPAGTLSTITIPKAENYLQIYTIGVMKQTKTPGVAGEFEDFMLSAAGQQTLRDYGFRLVS